MLGRSVKIAAVGTKTQPRLSDACDHVEHVARWRIAISWGDTRASLATTVRSPLVDLPDPASVPPGRRAQLPPSPAGRRPSGLAGRVLPGSP